MVLVCCMFLHLSVGRKGNQFYFNWWYWKQNKFCVENILWFMIVGLNNKTKNHKKRHYLAPFLFSPSCSPSKRKRGNQPCHPVSVILTKAYTVFSDANRLISIWSLFNTYLCTSTLQLLLISICLQQVLDSSLTVLRLFVMNYYVIKQYCSES